MNIGDGFKARLEFVLEQAFGNLSGGGDHETRAHVAQELLRAAQSGIVKLEDLKQIASSALRDTALQDAALPRALPDALRPQLPPSVQL
jgi:hypothetical protein